MRRSNDVRSTASRSSLQIKTRKRMQIFESTTACTPVACIGSCCRDRQCYRCLIWRRLHAPPVRGHGRCEMRWICCKSKRSHVVQACVPRAASGLDPIHRTGLLGNTQSSDILSGYACSASGVLFHSVEAMTVCVPAGPVSDHERRLVHVAVTLIMIWFGSNCWRLYHHHQVGSGPLSDSQPMYARYIAII